MWNWTTFWLILHILAVIVAFGPTFAFPLMASLARKDPRHAYALAHAIDQIEHRITIPLAILVPLFGTALIYTAHIDLWKSEWLIVSIIVYIAAFSFALFVQGPTSVRFVKAIAEMEMAMAAKGEPPPPPPEVSPGGPPPHIAAMAKRLQFGGMYLTLSIVVILVLMVWQPGGAGT